ncbi:MAG: large repetitive protein, partial [Candidatus Binatota bacterium]|nr:large repetitive protein [Candidatus Binatota bacterium]
MALADVVMTSDARATPARHASAAFLGFTVLLFAPLATAQDRKVGSEFRVNNATVENQEQVSVAADSEGNFVVVWKSDHLSSEGEIFGRRYDSAGSALGDEFLVNSSPTGTQREPAVAAASNGAFVVVWNSPDNYGVVARRFSSSGASQGSEFVVGAPTDAPRYPAVAADSEGNFVVVWEVQNGVPGDPEPPGVVGQRFSSAGAALGDEFVLSSVTTGSQTHPAVGMSADGSFVVTWENL